MIPAPLVSLVRCKKCNEQVTWVMLANGRAAPLDWQSKQQHESGWVLTPHGCKS